MENVNNKINRREWLSIVGALIVLPKLYAASNPPQGFVNVRNVGAKGDGITNDTKVIQACINKHSKIFFPKGIYNIESINIPSNKYILGEGKDISELRNITTVDNHFINSDKQKNIIIESLFLNGNKDNRLANNQKAIYGSTIQISNTEIKNRPRNNNVTIKNCVISGNGFNNIGGLNAHAVKIINCKFINGRDSGISATQGCSNWAVDGCEFDNTMLFAISFSNNGVKKDIYQKVDMVRQILISNNIIQVGHNVDTHNNDIPGIGIEIDGCKNIRIVKNKIKITPTGKYGIRLIPSYAYANIFDCNDITIENNIIQNDCINETCGVEIFNDTIDNRMKNIKIVNNNIQTNVLSKFTGIYCYNTNDVTIDKNKIHATIADPVRNNTYKTGITIEGDNIDSISISNNDITGGAWVGLQFGARAIKNRKNKINLTSNSFKGNQTNLGVDKGWRIKNIKNKIDQPNYITPGSITDL